MNKISHEIIETIRKKTDIVDIISSYITLTPKGKNYFGICPFHDDNHPSMSVSKEKQIYKCFSCGASGNVFTFISEYENISFIESIKKLADMCHIPLHLHAKDMNKEKNKSFYEMYDISQKFYQNNIYTKEGHEAREYLKGRDIPENVIKEFGIGLALKNKQMLAKLLTSKNFSSKNIEESGLVVKKSYEYMDLYYDRIMFPLCDLEGRVVGFSGRIYHGEDISKYINTRETILFKKGELLYNYHRAKQPSRKIGSIIIVEGFMDVIRCFTAGVYNVVATMGTAITKTQAQLIKRMAKTVILCFDGDEAGSKATLSCANELFKIGVSAQVVRLEDQMDPDEYIKEKGSQKFKDKLAHPLNLLDFKMQYYKKGKDLNSAEDAANYLNTIIDQLSQIDDEVMREVSLKKLSDETKLDILFLRKKVNEKRSDIQKEIKRDIFTKKRIEKKVDKYTKAQQNLLFYMLLDTDVVKIYLQKKPYFPNQYYQKLALEIAHFYTENRCVNIADIITRVEGEKEVKNAIQKIVSLDLDEVYKKEEIYDYIKVIYDYNIEFEIKRLKNKMLEETIPKEKALIAEQIVKLKMEES